MVYVPCVVYSMCTPEIQQLCLGVHHAWSTLNWINGYVYVLARRRKLNFVTNLTYRHHHWLLLPPALLSLRNGDVRPNDWSSEAWPACTVLYLFSWNYFQLNTQPRPQLGVSAPLPPHSATSIYIFGISCIRTPYQYQNTENFFGG